MKALLETTLGKLSERRLIRSMRVRSARGKGQDHGDGR